MKNKKVLIISLLLYLFLFNSCRKAVRADQVYIGDWICPGSYYTSFITFTQGGFGTYYTIGYNGVDNRKNPFKGTARIDWSSNHIYIGITKFKIIQHPHLDTTVPNSLGVFGKIHHTCGIEMTLENSYLHGNRILNFYKVID